MTSSCSCPVAVSVAFGKIADLEAFAIARAPIGADIPMPNRIDTLEGVTGQNRDDITKPNTSDIPGPQDFGTEEE